MPEDRVLGFDTAKRALDAHAVFHTRRDVIDRRDSGRRILRVLDVLVVCFRGHVKDDIVHGR